MDLSLGLLIIFRKMSEKSGISGTKNLVAACALQVMAQAEADSWNRRVASVVKRHCGNDFPLQSVGVIEVKDLSSTRLSSKSCAPG